VRLLFPWGLGPPAWLRQPRALLLEPHLGRSRPGPQSESRDLFLVGVRLGLQDEEQHLLYDDQRLEPLSEQGPPSSVGVRGWDPRMRAGTTPVCGGQRLGSQDESRDHLLGGHESRSLLSLACPQSTFPRPRPPQGKKGSLEPQQCVPGGRCLATVGSGPGMGEVPVAPLATLCNSWSSFQDRRSHAQGLEARGCGSGSSQAQAHPAVW